ncbi:MAG: Holliday junction resolvase RuvX [Myxococcales bacterium]|nr:Holliday junction resolvase RuvX [Myxococcales bacterium]
MRRLGIDPGRRRIGLALTDEEGRLALPLRTLETAGRPKAAADEIALEVERSGIEEIVIGLPLNLDGTEGDASRRARAFGALVAARVEVPISFWDERLTTAMAERSLAAMGLDGRARRKVVDQSAAALLLQSYVDAKTEASWLGDRMDADALPAIEPPARPRGRGRARGRGRVR